MVFYSLGLIYHDSKVFKNYTTVMTYINIIVACTSQIIFAFILAIISEPIEVMQLPAKSGESSQFIWEVRRDSYQIYR